ncbi:MAG TPA: MFS transporter [Candidatus Bathyarchaeia archaeon]|nr:MFS transporter [Candidatus Bathyarchaeia archaeon]
MEQVTVQNEQSASQTLVSVRTRSRLILALVIIAGFLDVVDFSIVNVALPAIRTNFLVSLAESQWIIGAYGLTMAGFLMLSGRAGDIYGQKRLFIIGIIVFTVSSLTAGFAPSLLILVASRAVQGIGAAMTSATALSILVTTFPEGKERNRALGTFVAILSAGFAAGAIAGGVLTAGFGWRSVMFVNVPIGIVAAVLSQRFLPATGGRALDRHLDLPGALSVTSGLVLLVYALTNAANEGFSSVQTILPLSLSAVILAAFVAIEHRSKSPLMPLGFLRRGTVLMANVLGLIFTAGAGGVLFILTIYLQQVLGYSALNAGLAFLPLTMIFFVGGGWGSTWLVNRIGMKATLVSSTALMTIGSAQLTQISVAGGYFGIFPGMILWVLGASLSFTALNIAGLAGTRPGEEGLASGLLNTSQRVGAPLGLAILLTVVSATDPPPAVVAGPGSLTGIVTGFQYAFLASAILNGIGLVIALRMRRAKAPVGYQHP